jgi:hypothetical protein
MMKQCNPAYSPGVAARTNDPWRKILNQYRTVPSWVRPYRPLYRAQAGDRMAPTLTERSARCV